MKRIITSLLILAGALFQNVIAQTVPGTSPQFKRASELIGADVRNQDDEKIGVVKDVMIDLPASRMPFIVVSSGGFFGVGDRLSAVPAKDFASSTDDLALSRENLQAAVSFDKDRWPDINRTQPAPVAIAANTEIIESAGANKSSATRYSNLRFYDEPPISNRRPRQGLGSQDLMRYETKTPHYNNTAKSNPIVHEPAGAERPSIKVKRASELIGMEVKNAQNERVGEIKDVVIDLHSGLVAYAVVDAAGMFDTSDKFFAVPPTILTRSGDDRWLIFNTDKEMLQNAPSFEKNNWPQAQNQPFTAGVYRYYQQPPLWQTAIRDIREPSGGELQ